MSFVYLIASGRNIIKVGMARDVGKRARALQTAGPFEMQIIHKIEVADDHVAALEKLIHKRLKRYHLRGEWFCVERKTAIDIAQRTANQFGKDRSFAVVDEDFRSEVVVKCRACSHQATVKVEPRPRMRFRCTKCSSAAFAVTV
jgi:hypothetical protein